MYIGIGVGLCVLCLILIVVAVVLARRRHKKAAAGSTKTGTVELDYFATGDGGTGFAGASSVGPEMASARELGRAPSVRESIYASANPIAPGTTSVSSVTYAAMPSSELDAGSKAIIYGGFGDLNTAAAGEVTYERLPAGH